MGLRVDQLSPQPQGDLADDIVDVKKAVAWVKEHIGEYGGDPSFVAISGGSAGGHLSALHALTVGDPSFQPGFEEVDMSVQAAAPFYGVMDMTGSPEGSGAYGPGLLEMLEKSVMKTTFAQHPEVFEAASPTERVHAGAPPFYVFQGANDTLVPVQVARTFVERLRAVSRQPVAYAELPLAQHAFDVLASLRCLATTSGVADFLEAAVAAHPGCRRADSGGRSDSGEAHPKSWTSRRASEPATAPAWCSGGRNGPVALRWDRSAGLVGQLDLHPKGRVFDGDQVVEAACVDQVALGRKRRLRGRRVARRP